MSAFPPPLNQPPVFNPSLFTSAVTNIIAAVDPNPQAYLEYPTAQGPVNFVSGSNQTTVGAQNLAILTNVGTTDNGIIFGANGLVYNGVTGPLGITWSNLATKIEAIQALSQASDVTTLNVNNTIRVQDGETESDPISYINISSGITNAIVSTTDLLFEAPNIDISGQAIFQLPPHIPEPILGNDAASKGYVDSLVGQYSGGYNLFFNYSETDATYPTNKVLAKLVSAAAQQTNVITGFTSGTEIVATFITEPFNISEIPAGLWDALVYGAVSGTGGDVHYSYEVFKVDDLGNETSIAQSGISADVNASPNNNPTAYSMNATFSTAIVMVSTDRIRIVLSATKTGTNTISLTTYFEAQYYSFIQTSLNAGTNITGSNNVFTGTNAFSLPPTTPLQTGTPANTDIVNYETITTLIGNIPAPTTPSLADVLTVDNKANIDIDMSYNSIININSLSVLNVSDTATLSPTQIQISDATKIMTISNNLINAFGADGAITIQNDRLYVQDVSGNVNYVSRDSGILTTDSTGKYLSLNNTTGLNINGLAGSEGQVLSKDVSNNMVWATPEPIVSTLQYFISQTSPFFQYPPQQPTSALIASYQYYGWYFINSVALRKIDWFFAPDYAMTVADVKGLYMNYFNVTTTSNENLPFISIYTKPTGTGDIIPGFAHSVATYIANFNPTAATAYCSFMNLSGTQPNPFPYGHQLGEMILSPVAPNPRGQYLPTEEVLAISIGSNSTSTVNQVNFIMGKVGICLEQGNQENILNPQDILLIPTISQVLTSGSVASNQNISGINTLTATKLVTPTIDNSGNTLTIGANTTGLTLGKLATTTNIQGNLQINASSGTSGQVLTSNGTTTEWATPASSWVGAATSNLSMGNNKISVGDGTGLNVDISDNGFKLYNQSTLSVDIGFGSITTYRNGNPNKTARLDSDIGLFCYNGLEARGIQISNTDILVDNVAGSANQVLSKDASNILTWATPTDGWTGTATSQLNMGIYDISGAVLDNSGGTLTVGANVTALTLGKTATTTNIQGNLQINASSGTSGQFLTSAGSGAPPTWTTGGGGGSWVGTATSDLTMGVYNISSAVLDNSGNTLTLGGNTTTTTIGKATTGITNLQGVVKINNSAGSSGQVLTSTGASTAPTWQTASAPNTTYFQSFQSFGEGLNIASCAIYLPITIVVPSITATYLISSSTFMTTTIPTVVGSDVFISIAQQAGAVANPGTANNILGGALAFNALANGTSFTKTTITSITATSALSFSYIFTPGIAGQRTFGILMYATLGGTKRTQSLQMIQLTA